MSVDEDEITPVMSFLVSPDLRRNHWVLLHDVRFTIGLVGGKTFSIDVPSGSRAPGDCNVLMLRGNLILNHLLKTGFKEASARRLAQSAYLDDLRRVSGGASAVRMSTPHPVLAKIEDQPTPREDKGLSSAG